MQEVYTEVISVGGMEHKGTDVSGQPLTGTKRGAKGTGRNEIPAAARKRISIAQKVRWAKKKNPVLDSRLLLRRRRISQQGVRVPFRLAVICQFPAHSAVSSVNTSQT